MSPRPKRQSRPIRASSSRAPIPLPMTGIVRLARVAEARRRIASGWYDRTEVRDSLVEAVLEEFRSR